MDNIQVEIRRLLCLTLFGDWVLDTGLPLLFFLPQPSHPWDQNRAVVFLMVHCQTEPGLDCQVYVCLDPQAS